MTATLQADDRVSILLVDDKPANLIALESFLSKEDYTIVTATSGAQALSLLQSGDFAVILTDVMMPEMDGYEFASQVKQIVSLRDIPIIFMTAMAGDVVDIFRGYAIGAVDYLQKPLEPEVVKAKVTVFVQLVRQKRLIERQAAQLLENERREQEYRLLEMERSALTERKQAAATQRELEWRVAQQLALAQLSRLALLRRNNDELMQDAASVVQQTLHVDIGLLTGLNENGTAWEVKAGFGRKQDLIGRCSCPIAADAWVQMHNEAKGPLVFHDMAALQLFPLHAELETDGVVDGASVAIHGEAEPFGALSVFSCSPHIFSAEETSFLQAVGNILGIAFERQKSESAIRELTRSNNDLEQFSFAASHDLQEPLRKITSFSQLLAQDYRSQLEGDGLMYLDFIVDGANRMKTMIEDLLDLSRVSVGKISRDPCALKQTVEAAMNNLAVSIAEHGASISVGPLPSLRVDTSNFVRLFQNLISNSLKYRAEAPPIIQISCERVGKEWRFCVRDNGIGINPCYLDRIFIIFKRLHSKTKYPGTGIGLALCKKIIDRHGGRIWAESSGEGGTAFYFTLPVEHEPGPSFSG
ncbi:response regulator [Oligoflexus tunisiensis]|uniref:response regulator n=1 Tax=Oligoflexus tunisiensis TaxID=708132 RepID=UPI00114CCD0E|nr:response regulator [Oligoflexus tunisiensis]